MRLFDATIFCSRAPLIASTSAEAMAIALELAQSTVSQALKQLKQAGYIYGGINGPPACYCVNRPMATQFKNLTGDLVGGGGA